VVSKWDAVFTVCGMPDKDVESIGRDIIQRLKKQTLPSIKGMDIF
jgi:hypothetical protein